MGVNDRMIITDGIHLTSTENEEELHAFASAIGLKREWFQCHSYHPKRTRPHYDLTTAKAVRRAIVAGATKVTGKFLLENSWWAARRNCTRLQRGDAMNLILQPPGSSLCGQACVAMAASTSLEESILLFGHCHATRTKELVRVLNCQTHGGIKCAWGRLKSLKSCDPWPQRAIIKEIYGPTRQRKSHWVLLWDGKIYDPDPHDTPGTKYSSYIEIISNGSKGEGER